MLANYANLRLDIEKKRNENDGLFIDATERYRSIFPQPLIEAVYYLDFYSLPQFGKTKLGILLQKAKVGDSHSKEFIDIIAAKMQKGFDFLKKRFAFDAGSYKGFDVIRDI